MPTERTTDQPTRGAATAAAWLSSPTGHERDEARGLGGSLRIALSDDQYAVLDLLVDGHAGDEISRRLGMAAGAPEGVLRQVLLRLGVRVRPALIPRTAGADAPPAGPRLRHGGRIAPDGSWGRAVRSL